MKVSFLWICLLLVTGAMLPPVDSGQLEFRLHACRISRMQKSLSESLKFHFYADARSHKSEKDFRNVSKIFERKAHCGEVIFGVGQSGSYTNPFATNITKETEGALLALRVYKDKEELNVFVWNVNLQNLTCKPKILKSNNKNSRCKLSLRLKCGTKPEYLSLCKRPPCEAKAETSQGIPKTRKHQQKACSEPNRQSGLEPNETASLKQKERRSVKSTETPRTFTDSCCDENNMITESCKCNRSFIGEEGRMTTSKSQHSELKPTKRSEFKSNDLAKNHITVPLWVLVVIFLAVIVMIVLILCCVYHRWRKSRSTTVDKSAETAENAPTLTSDEPREILPQSDDGSQTKLTYASLEFSTDKAADDEKPQEKPSISRAKESDEECEYAEIVCR